MGKYIFVVMLLFSYDSWAQVRVTDLKIENQNNPIGLSMLNPRFNWILLSDKRNVKQTAFEIQVSEDNTIVWASSKVSSEASVHIPYKGKPLESGKRYKWKVRVWDNLG